MDFNERQACFNVQGADGVTILAIRADEACHRDDTGVGEQLGHLADTADILLAVGGREAEIFIQAVANIVAVEDVGKPAPLDDRVFEGEGDGALARAA